MSELFLASTADDETQPDSSSCSEQTKVKTVNFYNFFHKNLGSIGDFAVPACRRTLDLEDTRTAPQSNVLQNKTASLSDSPVSMTLSIALCVAHQLMSPILSSVSHLKYYRSNRISQHRLDDCWQLF